MTTLSTEVGLRLPNNWLEFDPRAEDVSAEMAEAAHRVWGEDVDLTVFTEAAAPVAAELRRLAAVADLVLAGCYAEQVTGEDDEPLLLTATVLLAVSPPVDGLPAIRRGLAASGANLEILGVELPAGSAVVASGPVTIERPEWTDQVPAYFERYFVPVAGSDRAAVLAFLTPNIDLTAEFSRLFHVIAESLTITSATAPAR